MSFSREEVLAKVGTRVELHDDVHADGTVGMVFSKHIPAGTTGTVIHANLDHRFSHPEDEPEDLYEAVIAWNLAGRPIDRFDQQAYRLFITERAEQRSTMDPDATWRELCITLGDLRTHPEDYDLRAHAIELLEALIMWLRNRGFPPTMTL